jgi:hypothetical protein
VIPACRPETRTSEREPSLPDKRLFSAGDYLEIGLKVVLYYSHIRFLPALVVYTLQLIDTSQGVIIRGLALDACPFGLRVEMMMPTTQQ